MKIIAINSSPRSGGQSKTELLLNHLVEGMRDAGAEVDIVNLREKKIKNCLGCFTCWTKTPGRCIQKDDMTTEIYPKHWRQSPSLWWRLSFLLKWATSTGKPALPKA